MNSDDFSGTLDKLRNLAVMSPDPTLIDAVQKLGEAIKVGNISGSTGVAIGRNIRMVINQLQLPPEMTAALLDLRTVLGTQLGIDPELYPIGTIIADRTRNFTGRQHIFRAIDNFMGKNPCGYLFIEGMPGDGLCSILAEFVKRTGSIAHFNNQTYGVNKSSNFLENVCSQIIVQYDLAVTTLPEDARRNGRFLLQLLEQASKKLRPDERLTISVNALHEVDLSEHPPGSNILFLPDTLPDKVYFILSRRQSLMPFVCYSRIESISLADFPKENAEDIEGFLLNASKRTSVKQWIATNGISTDDFIRKLAARSEGNFLYLRYMLEDIERGFYKAANIEQVPTGLQMFYEDHWRRMGMAIRPLPRIKLEVLYVLSQIHQPISLALLARIIKEDRLQIQEILDEWSEYLHKAIVKGETRYSIYHSSFRHFLLQRNIIRAAGISIRSINLLLTETIEEE
jgi:hypothetical protein